jgi:hypothetical protein
VNSGIAVVNVSFSQGVRGEKIVSIPEIQAANYGMASA